MFDYSKLVDRPEDFKLSAVWAMFEAVVIPESASQVQRTEMRKAFYSGFLECFKCINDFSCGIDEAKAMKLFDRLQTEGLDFIRSEIRVKS